MWFNPYYAFVMWLNRAWAFTPRWKSFLAFHVFTPFIFLTGFGFFGEALYQNHIDMDYRTYILSSFFCFSGVIGALTNMAHSFYHEIDRGEYNHLIITHARISELMLGRCFWSASRTMAAAILTLFIGQLWLNVQLTPLQNILAIIFLFTCNLTMTTIGLFFVAFFIYHRNMTDTYKIIEAPMLVFSGVFIPITLFPEWVQSIIHISPLYHAVTVTRELWRHTDITVNFNLHFLPLLLVATFCYLVGTWQIKRRLLT